MKFIFRTSPTLSLLLSSGLLLSSCSGAVTSPGAAPGAMPGAEASANAEDPAGAAPRAAGSEDSAQLLKLALKFVEYVDETGKPVLTQEEAQQLTNEMNQLFAACNLQLQTEEYIPVEPLKFGLEYHTQSMNELDPIRSNFDDPKRLVVINTGNWDHSSMGSANAWTNMPGEPLSGAVIEGKVASFAGIVAHELGHYLDLPHVDDESNLMNPIIYKTSTGLTPAQCEIMREAAQTSRSGALR